MLKNDAETLPLSQKLRLPSVVYVIFLWISKKKLTLVADVTGSAWVALESVVQVFCRLFLHYSTRAYDSLSQYISACEIYIKALYILVYVTVLRIYEGNKREESII